MYTARRPIVLIQLSPSIPKWGACHGLRDTVGGHYKMKSSRNGSLCGCIPIISPPNVGSAKHAYTPLILLILRIPEWHWYHQSPQSHSNTPTLALPILSLRISLPITRDPQCYLPSWSLSIGNSKGTWEGHCSPPPLCLHIYHFNTVHSIWHIRSYVAPGIAGTHCGSKHTLNHVSCMCPSFTLQEPILCGS